MSDIKTIGYIQEPRTIADFEYNARFQLENVEGFMSVKNWSSAYLKLDVLRTALDLVCTAHRLFGSGDEFVIARYLDENEIVYLNKDLIYIYDLGAASRFIDQNSAQMFINRNCLTEVWAVQVKNIIL